ncbi:MAG: hypothetical protein DSZ33_01605 [Gammaproteobacteria bacterium]|nr:MAG: hypothetical protein DSZ33_01605 [Gammaproteobacteria bacterium]
MASSDKTERKLAAARTQLILDKPFLGALVLRLPMIQASPDWCRTTATDARSFYYNAEYIDSLSMSQTQFMLAHEALHCALSHFARRQNRNRHRWDLACDFAINPLLLADGLSPPADTLYLSQYEDMTAEEIYPLIDEDDEQEPLDQHLYDNSEKDDSQSNKPDHGGDQGVRKQPQQEQQPLGGSGAKESENSMGGAQPPPALSNHEREELRIKWQQRLAGAAQQALQAGKLGEGMARLVDHLLQPQLPWRALLARYMTAVARDDFSFARPSRREGSAILPSLRSAEINIAVVIDTSGSISDAEMKEFVSEVNAIKGQLRAAIVLHACDETLCEKGPWRFAAWEELSLPDSLGGGAGTSFLPAFQWAESLERRPDLLVYFTDADGEFPPVEPSFPVLWLVKGRKAAPWGMRVQLN